MLFDGRIKHLKNFTSSLSSFLCDSFFENNNYLKLIFQINFDIKSIQHKCIIISSLSMS